MIREQEPKVLEEGVGLCSKRWHYETYIILKRYLDSVNETRDSRSQHVKK